MDTVVRNTRDPYEKLIATVRAGNVSWKKYPGIKNYQDNKSGPLGGHQAFDWCLPLSNNLMMHITETTWAEINPGDLDWEYAIQIIGWNFGKDCCLMENGFALHAPCSRRTFTLANIQKEINDLVFEYTGKDAYNCCVIDGWRKPREI